MEELGCKLSVGLFPKLTHRKDRSGTNDFAGLDPAVAGFWPVRGNPEKDGQLRSIFRNIQCKLDVPHKFTVVINEVIARKQPDPSGWI